MLGYGYMNEVARQEKEQKHRIEKLQNSDLKKFPFVKKKEGSFHLLVPFHFLEAFYYTYLVRLPVIPREHE